MRKPDFRICENKDADQLRGNREADQRLCFRYTDSTIPLLPKSESHCVWLYSPVCMRPGRKPRRPVFLQRGSYIHVAATMKTKLYKNRKQTTTKTAHCASLVIIQPWDLLSIKTDQHSQIQHFYFLKMSNIYLFY